MKLSYKGGSGPDRFGRTDRGRKGILDFFSTHKCNDICRALGLKEGGDARVHAQLEERRAAQQQDEILAAIAADDAGWQEAPLSRRNQRDRASPLFPSPPPKDRGKERRAKRSARRAKQVGGF